MDGSAEGRFSIRAICKEGSTFLQMLSAIAFVLRVSLVDANSPPSPPAPPREADRRYPRRKCTRVGSLLSGLRRFSSSDPQD